jgi:tetratricopeptide (TPR) repeat protein
MLRETAELDPNLKPIRDSAGVAIDRGNDARADALFALILVYNRERRWDDALQVLADLQQLFPRNRLLWLEAGSTALRAGRAQQAEKLLNEGLAMLAKDTRPRIPGEEALWRYKRGAARAALGRTDEALTDLTVASSADSQNWVNGRARVELGRLALKRGDRNVAVQEARQAETLCERGNDPVCIEDARALLRSSNGR